MNRIVVFLAAGLLLCSVAAAKEKDKADDKTRSYDTPIEKVWDACVASANENFVIEHSEKASGILNFHSGQGFLSGGFTCGVVISQTGGEGKVRVQLNTQKRNQTFAFGAGGRIADKFFKGVEKYLKEGRAKV